MSEYGVTDNGFVLKRMDTILEEIHKELTEGFGVDTRLNSDGFLQVIVTSFSGQIADLWEKAQDSYYAKYPSTASGLNLDNAVQYGGIKRESAKQSTYPLHCTGEDGTTVPKGTVVETDTSPALRLMAANSFTIQRSRCNAISIRVAAIENKNYTMTINGKAYSFVPASGGSTAPEILNGLKDLFDDDGYTVTIEEGEDILNIVDNTAGRNNEVVLSDNLTTSKVVSIANFLTESYGRITIPHGLVTVMASNITGFHSVVNKLDPTYGRDAETDTELRQAYRNKKAGRSNTMVDSIVAELLNNVAGVETASGFENDTDETDSRGLPPHSIEIVVEGGDAFEVAKAILLRKAGGIQTFGSVEIDVPGNYGDAIKIRFNRPEYLYTWLKIELHGDTSTRPSNYEALAISSASEYCDMMVSGEDLLIQKLHEGIYEKIPGVTYINIYTAYGLDKSYRPSTEDYRIQNIIASSRQKILLDDSRIEVSFVEDS